jgi:hypothetical protein
MKEEKTKRDNRGGGYKKENENETKGPLLPWTLGEKSKSTKAR